MTDVTGGGGRLAQLWLWRGVLLGWVADAGPDHVGPRPVTRGTIMRIRLLLAAAATLALAGCSSSPTAPALQPGARSNDDLTCRGGYHIATRDDGSTTCEADAMAVSTP